MGGKGGGGGGGEDLRAFFQSASSGGGGGGGRQQTQAEANTIRQSRGYGPVGSGGGGGGRQSYDKGGSDNQGTPTGEDAVPTTRSGGIQMPRMTPQFKTTAKNMGKYGTVGALLAGPVGALAGAGYGAYKGSGTKGGAGELAVEIRGDRGSSGNTGSLMSDDDEEGYGGFGYGL